MSKSNSKKFAIGALIGIATGFVAGILTAPKSGKETRKDIKNTAAKVTLQLEKNLKSIYAELDDLLAKGKIYSKKYTGKAKKQLEVALAQAQKAQNKVKEVLSTLRSGETDNPELKRVINDANRTIKNLKKYLKK